ncbi:hypothetical protein JCM8208_004284 [Rhodotorula glutinis]
MASYAALPAELVIRIAEQVHAQDRAWRALGILRLEHPSDRDSDFEDDDGCSAKQWSNQYGRGIRALVRNITGPATADIYFRFDVLGQPLGDHVRHVDCSFDSSDQIVSLACALRGLPNLSSLKFDARSLYLLGGNVRGQPRAHQVLVQALKDVLGRVTTLELACNVSKGVLRALSHVDKHRLRRLVVPSVTGLLPLSNELAAALLGLDALAEVELGNLSAYNLVKLQERLRLPHVRSLTVAGQCMGEGLLHEHFLVFAHHVAVSVEVLFIRDAVDAQGYGGEPILPSLRILRVDSLDIPRLGGLVGPQLPALEHVHVVARARGDNGYPIHLDDILHLRATSLRTLTVEYSAAHPPVLSAPVRARFDELGVRIINQWRPDPASTFDGIMSGSVSDHRMGVQRESGLERLF